MKRKLSIVAVLLFALVAFIGCATTTPTPPPPSEKVLAPPPPVKAPAAGKITVRAVGDFQQSLKFAWQQIVEDLPSLDKWILYVRASAGATTPLSKIDVPYTGGAGPDFTAQSGFTVTGNPGATVRRYFVMTAVSKNGTESGFSNEVFFDFQLPYANVSAPMTLQVPVVVSPQP